MKTQRIRDPIHDLVVFEEESPDDMTAWRLLQTPDLQRMRRVKQLGVSEFVFPSATHSRLAHSVGVFHNARRLVRLIHREIKLKRTSGEFSEQRARVASFAALLHDIGHGPFSHAFEEARKALGAGKDKAPIRKHEHFTADMIIDPAGEIGAILTDAGVDPKEVASLIGSEVPIDMYHAIVSSSFDADRLDYLMRDRYMTGTQIGAIDLGWLMDNVRVKEIDMAPPEGESDGSAGRHSFCLEYKAREAAEDFLLARYRLYTTVYFHKTTRGIEQLLSAFFRSVAELGREKETGLSEEDPLVRFFADGDTSLATYRQLDDTVVWGAIQAAARRGKGEIGELADRIVNRRKALCVDVQTLVPEHPERQRRLKHALDKQFGAQLGRRVFRDTARLSIYGEVGADDRRAQQRLMVRSANGDVSEITDFKDATVAGPIRPRVFERYYFLDGGDHETARKLADTI